jgi:hypothetical protein
MKQDLCGREEEREARVLRAILKPGLKLITHAVGTAIT